MGYHYAGFEVVGVDILPQPSYPFEFHRMDALKVNFRGFDVIHASPPCPAYSALKTLNGNFRPALVEQTRSRLQASGLPYVIENVEGAPLENYAILCGSMFGLDIQRHRVFETNWGLKRPSRCKHEIWTNEFPLRGARAERYGYTSKTVRVHGGSQLAYSRKHEWELRKDAMEIDWMTWQELNDAVPPRYTEFIGHRLHDVIGFRGISLQPLG